MNDAIQGENDEHAMGMWAAVKTHPWACLWAFTMCFTIVSLPSFPHINPDP
jgi:SP family general alpha glucoside:H+ symporter-like MFS transporter